MPRVPQLPLMLLVIPAIGMLFLNIAGHEAAIAQESAPQFEVVIEGSSVIYKGEITPMANAYLFSLIDNAEQPLKTLEITSVGGNVDAALELANWVFNTRLDIYIPSFCGSSCANYVFPAAQRKLLGETAMLAWHGGATQKNVIEVPECEEDGWYKEYFDCDADAYMKQMSKMIAGLKVKEAVFFEKIGVDQQITVIGQKPEYVCGGDEVYNGWFYSLEDMERLGIKNVEIVGAEWAPEPPSADIKVCRVSLSDK